MENDVLPAQYAAKQCEVFMSDAVPEGHMVIYEDGHLKMICRIPEFPEIMMETQITFDTIYLSQIDFEDCKNFMAKKKYN